MNLRTAITAATTAAVLATGGIALAGAADTPTSSTSSPAVPTAAPSTPKTATPAITRRRARHLRARARKLVVGVVDETIGIDRATLRHDLRAGKTIAEIATAHHVDPQDVVKALVTAATTKLDAAANAGVIKTTRAQKIEAKLPARFTKLVDTWHPRRVQNHAKDAPVA
jgi:hypothetical protein